MDSHYQVSAVSKVKWATYFSPDVVNCNYNILTTR